MGSGDLLPGLCALAQQWLRDVALPGFRDMPAHSASLTDWYSDKRVSLYLQVQFVTHLHYHCADGVKVDVWQRFITGTHCMFWLHVQVTEVLEGLVVDFRRNPHQGLV